MRKLTAFVMLLLLSVVLVACGGEEDEPEPTAAPTQPPVSTRISESSPESTVDAAGAAADATPEGATATPDAVVDDATPVSEATPAGSATPSVLPATPVATPVLSGLVQDSSPAATPEVSREGTPGATPVPTGLNEPPVRIEMSGVVTLDGRENEAFILTDEGCVGLGTYSGLHTERQVVIRNEEGTIVSVTTLEAADDVDGCGWRFVAAVPESEFYSVSIPMVFEQVFAKAQVAESGGAVEIALP